MVVLHLLERGVLNEVPMDVRIDYRRSIPQMDIDDLVERMRSRLVPGANGARLVSLSSAGRARCNIADVIEAVFAGRLVPRATIQEGVGAGALLFDPDEVGVAVRVESPTMAINEAAAALGVDEKNLRIWMAAGLIDTQAGAGRAERGRRITGEELARFRAAYVTVTEISKQVGIRSVVASRKIEGLGIISLVPEAKTAIYPRAVLTEDLVRQVGAK